MQIVYRPKFVREFKRFPREIQELVAQKEEIFYRDPFDPRLKTHKLRGRLYGFYAFWMDYRRRIIFYFATPEIAYFVAIGGREIYD
ncbi:MAG: hypothetical protein HW383_542 [Candidatus Magasanikbacteria bacterium]|nr:hypothetical protein [Candidatus Magasanikbacteria bacterium]